MGVGYRNKQVTLGGPAGPIVGNQTTVSSTPYTAAGDDHTLFVDATSGAVTINLPDAATCDGKIYHIKKTDSSANAVTIDANGSQTIDGATTFVLPLQYDCVSVQSNAANWFII